MSCATYVCQAVPTKTLGGNTGLQTDDDIWGSFDDPIGCRLGRWLCTFDQQIVGPLRTNLDAKEGEGHRTSAT